MGRGNKTWYLHSDYFMPGADKDFPFIIKLILTTYEISTIIISTYFFFFCGLGNQDLER